MSLNGRVFVGFKVNRAVWFKWRTLCRANGCTVEKATEVLLEEALQRFGVGTDNSPIDQRNPRHPMGDPQPSFTGTPRGVERSPV